MTLAKAGKSTMIAAIAIAATIGIVAGSVALAIRNARAEGRERRRSGLGLDAPADRG